MALGIPAYRRGCSLSLFNAVEVNAVEVNDVEVNDGADPLKSWTLTASSAGTVIRRLSLRQVIDLATDSEGFRLLKVSD